MQISRDRALRVRRQILQFREGPRVSRVTWRRKRKRNIVQLARALLVFVKYSREGKSQGKQEGWA